MGFDDQGRYRELFDAIDEGYCLCEIIVDGDDRPVDYRFLETNPLFEEMTGLEAAVGRTALELVPDLEPHWVETYARAALGGERIRFEQGSAAMGRWFDVFTMPLGERGRFGIVFKDVTARRMAELELSQSEARYRELAEREHKVALRLQQALLPDTLAVHPGVEIVSHYSASDEMLDVGGDWYDTIQWPSGETAVVVGDVVGHDLEAAAVMGRLRAATKALALAGEPSATGVLEALDTCARGPEGVRFVTAFVVVIDAEAATLRYASAGHPPALLCSGHGSARWLDDAGAPPAGIAGTHDLLIERTIDFEPGSAVILYTDGLVERRSTPIDDNLQRLEGEMVKLIECNFGSWTDIVLHWLDQAGPPTDDVVVVRVAKPDATAADVVVTDTDGFPPP